MGDIVREVESLVAGGVREVTLLGQTVNAYGRDLSEPCGLTELLRAVDAVPGLERLRFLTSHPKYMSDDIIDAMASLRTACEHMNLPVQAGDNEVLRRMRRTYTRDLWQERIAFTRDRMPDVTIATDIIVGFPGETEVQFMQTYDLLEETAVDKVHLAMYSPRPGTLSARWEDDIPLEEKRRRHQVLEQLQSRLLTERNARRLGETREVLVVHFADTRDVLGKLVDVRITKTSPWFLLGEPVGTPH
jgi:tRNA-2-methylthio-N6-dimethylallyladenosine synthase